MDSRHYWEENCGPVKYENFNSGDGYSRAADNNLNFATGALASEDDADYLGAGYLKKGKVLRQQDPMSHRIIEKRRRDRMNNCLADLSRLIPPDYCKKGRGRVEKTEIIEMAIRRLKYLQERNNGSDQQQEGPISVEHFRLGYQECRSEVMRYLVEAQGYPPTDSLCVHLIGHLNRHCDSIVKGDQLNHPRSNPETTSTSSGGSGSANYGADKSSVIAQTHRSHPHHSHEYRKRTYEEAPPTQYNPSPDEFINLSSLDDDAPIPITRPQHSQPPPTLRSVRKTDRDDYSDHAHSYKFKNTIKQRFSQDCDEAHDMTTKRRRVERDSSCPSVAPSLTSSNDEGVCRDASPESAAVDPRDPPSHIAPEPPPHRADKKLCIPIFALNSPGKYYIPLNVTYESLVPFVGSCESVISSSTSHPPLHPVTINVNFQAYSEPVATKLEPVTDKKWQPA